jgi:hypothetical protein
MIEMFYHMKTQLCLFWLEGGLPPNLRTLSVDRTQTRSCCVMSKTLPCPPMHQQHTMKVDAVPVVPSCTVPGTPSTWSIQRRHVIINMIHVVLFPYVQPTIRFVVPVMCPVCAHRCASKFWQSTSHGMACNDDSYFEKQCFQNLRHLNWNA